VTPKTPLLALIRLDLRMRLNITNVREPAFVTCIASPGVTSLIHLDLNVLLSINWPRNVRANPSKGGDAKPPVLGPIAT